MRQQIARKDAGVVDENVHAIVARGDGGDGLGDLRFAGYVADFGLGLSAGGADFVDGFRSVFDVEDFDARVFRRRRRRHPQGAAEIAFLAFHLQ
jgi:hypothetical protein